MNIRKETDYSDLFRCLDRILGKDQPQMQVVFMIGKAVCVRPEKGAAVAAAEYIQANYPDKAGFSPRNLRRMRNFYQMYCNDPELMDTAMQVGWTLNVAIMEAELTMAERRWYLQTTLQNGWTKSVLLQKLKVKTHLEENRLDINDLPCYNEDNEKEVICSSDSNPFYLSRQHLQKPDGRVYNERPGAEGRTFQPVRNSICCNQYRGDRESSLSASPSEAGRTWNRLFRQDSLAITKQGLRSLRSAHWNGSSKPAPDLSDLRRGFQRQSPSAVGLYQSSWRYSGPMVYRGFRYSLEGYRGGLPRSP